jgi:antitoxin MazE
MKARVVRIGNSRGIRIPKSVIEQCHLHGAVDLEIQQGQLVIRSATKPRAGWADAFNEMHQHEDDQLLDAEIGSSSWDEKEWTW